MLGRTLQSPGFVILGMSLVSERFPHLLSKEIGMSAWKALVRSEIVSKTVTSGSNNSWAPALGRHRDALLSLRAGSRATSPHGWAAPLPS